MCGGGGIGGVISKVGSSIGGAVKGVVSAVKDVAKNPVFQMVAPIALNMMMPGLGLAASGALGLSAAWAPAIGGALIGGGMGALSGKGFAGAAKGALIGGITAGVADYMANGTNPLSGMFSNNEGGALTNSLTAGGTGSTNLTGTGSGLGLDKSTLGTQFGQLDPSKATGSFGSLNPNVSGSFGSIKAPTGALGDLAKSSSGSGGFGGLWDKASGAVSKLIPDSTIGKVALGGVALSALNGMGSKPQDAAPPPNPATTDPQFTQRLQKLNLQYNPLQLNSNNNNLNTYGQATGSVDPSTFDPRSGKFRQHAQNQGEYQWVNPTYAPAAAQGGLLPEYAMGGLTQYAQGGMPDVQTDHGYLKGPGDGVSDDIPAVIGDNQPARLAGGEFVIPARIVSELGNGSSDAGAGRLHQMMERVNQRRVKSKDFAKDTKAYNLLPA